MNVTILIENIFIKLKHFKDFISISIIQLTFNIYPLHFYNPIVVFPFSHIYTTQLCTIVYDWFQVLMATTLPQLAATGCRRT